MPTLNLLPHLFRDPFDIAPGDANVGIEPQVFFGLTKGASTAGASHAAANAGGKAGVFGIQLPVSREATGTTVWADKEAAHLLW